MFLGRSKMPEEARRLAMASIQMNIQANAYYQAGHYELARKCTNNAIELENKARNAVYNLLEKN
jgi:hypothetical protein